MNRNCQRVLRSTLISPSRSGATQIYPSRSGATLIEVLMSLMIMGLGISSVFALFPMSVLRSVKATNLTNATLLSQSARDFFIANETVIEQQPVATDAWLSTLPAGSVPSPFGGTFVVDPYGGSAAAGFGGTQGKFGEVLRVQNGLNEPANPINSYVTGKDSWVTDYEDTQLQGVTANTVPQAPPLTGTDPAHRLEFYQTGGVPDFNQVATNRSRVLIYSIDGRRSLVRSLATTGTGPVPAANQLQLASALPDDMDSIDEIGAVRLQNFERRYTCLYTINQDENGNTQSRQIAVFFRRGFGESEQTYQATSFSTNKRTLTVNNYTVGIPRPGDYIFGAWTENKGGGRVLTFGRWYRLLLVEETATNQYKLTLDRTWVGKVAAGNNPKIMFPHGVVSVFDL
jgi:type II secretory pathway pseudopilin PulG